MFNFDAFATTDYNSAIVCSPVSIKLKTLAIIIIQVNENFTQIEDITPYQK